MEIPGYQPFYIESVAALRSEIVRLGLRIPVKEDVTPLAEPLVLGQRQVPNRFCAQPIAGGDAEPDGAPGDLTRRRYHRYAEGRFGLIWVEMTATGVPGKPRQLCLSEATLGAFREFVKHVRGAAVENPIIVVQLAADESDALIEGALLAEKAGFDGVDLQCSRATLPAALAGIRNRAPELLRATRLCLYEGVRDGFGVSAGDYRRLDPGGPIRFVEALRANGLDLLNVTAASPSLRGPDRGVRARSDAQPPDEHPLMTLERQLSLASALREAVSGLPIVGSGFSWLRQFVPQVAAGALAEGMMDIAGLGRGALAHPFAPAEVLAQRKVDAGATCMVCFACSQLRNEGEAVGCVLRDAAVYGPIYQQMRRFDADQLLAGASRCHLCEAAPCVRASPTRTDIPAFIAAFREGNERRAYEIIRERDPLPELTSRLSPAWLESEGACIETALTGTPVPILDLQYAIAWRARDQGETGVRVPLRSTGRTVGIVGAGPAGVAAAIRLIELGHTVHLYEQSPRLGGVPERVLSSHRGFSARAEIGAVLQPAFEGDRLECHFGCTVGVDIQLERLQAKHDAVLLATGLWRERTLGAERGVVSALEFLESPTQCSRARVAVLAGGDSAMDAARAVQSRGAQEIFVIFGGPRSAMHWHLPESWFATPGVHAMMNWTPLGYVTDEDGAVCGVRVRHSELHVESVLAVNFVIEAMELQVADNISAILNSAGAGIHTAGALVNGGASVSRCVADGIAAAEAIHQELSS